MNLQAATTEELLEIVGSGREMHSPDAVAAAEAELVRRAAGDEVRSLKKVRRAGTICAVVGGFFMLWGLSMAALGTSMLEVPRVESQEGPFVFRYFGVIYVVGALMEAAAGGVLLWGGLDLRKLRSRGRVLIVAVLWFGFGLIAVSTVSWVASLPWREAPGSTAVVMSAGGLIVAAFWSFLLWLPYRYFTSSRVRGACGE